MQVEKPNYLSVNDFLTSPESDSGFLAHYFTESIKFGEPRHYYQYASPTPDGSLFPWNKKKFILGSPHGQFERM